MAAKVFSHQHKCFSCKTSYICTQTVIGQDATDCKNPQNHGSICNRCMNKFETEMPKSMNDIYIRGQLLARFRKHDQATYSY